MYTYTVNGQPFAHVNLDKQCLSHTVKCNEAETLTAQKPYPCFAISEGEYENSIATWVSTTEYTGYDYSQCTCTIKGVLIDYGTATRICNFTVDGKIGDICPTTIVASCIAGYCDVNDSENACVPAPAGYYSPENDVACTKCSGGATSEAGSTSADACYYGAGTVFIDSLGSFKIPLSGKISVSF